VATFQAGGHEWRVRLTLGLVGRLRSDAGFDLGAAAGGGELARVLFGGEPETLGRVLWTLCRDEAQARGLTAPEAFYEMFGPEELDAAADALMEAVTDFFHRGRAAEIKKSLPGMKATLNARMTAAAVAAIGSMSSGSGGDSPASSASPPTT
jgi:hypothetical protein